eukprot:gene8817-1182_t
MASVDISELLGDITEEELKQAAAAGLLTPRQAKILGVKDTSKFRRGLMRNSRALAQQYSKTHVLCEGIEAMHSADRWVRTTLEDAGFTMAYISDADVDGSFSQTSCDVTITSSHEDNNEHSHESKKEKTSQTDKGAGARSKRPKLATPLINLSSNFQ